jgi:putative acetyltransferase
MVDIHRAESETDYLSAQRLIQEYTDSLGFDLCFQDFEYELAHLSTEYGPPDGCLFLAFLEGNLAGCVGLRKFDSSTCEMKRLYIKPPNRGMGLGKHLSEAVIQDARILGYQKIRLDTLASMITAREIYKKLGFVEIPAYRFNPIAGAIYMELDLTK